MRPATRWWRISLLAIALGCRPDAPPELSEDFARATNLGKAHLENRTSQDAVTAFSAAVELAPSAAPAWRNLARAQLLARDAEAALAALARAAELESESAATSYLQGLAHARESRFDAALPHFEAAVERDPHTAALRFQLANAYQTTGRHEPAVEQLRETLRLDPLHTSAHYKLAGYARRAGDHEELAARQRDLQRLRQVLGDENRTPETLERCLYTEAETAPARPVPAAPAVAVRFADATGELARSADDRAALTGAVAATVLDVDAEGRATLFVAASGGASLVTSGPDGVRVRAVASAELPGAAGLQAIAGNYHDDVPDGERYDPAVHAHGDVLLVGPQGVRLLKGGGAGAFEDVTAPAGLAGLRGRRARWADVENDGDLDLLIAGESGLAVWQNSGDGRFEEATAALGIDGGGAPAWDVAAADLDGNLAADVVVARGELPTRVLENQRVGRFRERPDPPGPWPAARRVLVNDLDADAYPDAVLVAGDGVRIVAGGSSRRQRLDLAGAEPAAAVLLDFDNDGALDLLVAVAGQGGEGRLRLWRNAPDGDWSDVTASTGLDAVRLAAVHELLAVDLDADGDTDVIALTGDGLRWLSNEGGHVHRQLKVRLVGTKTNPDGLGARLEARRGRFLLSRTVTELPVELGLGPHQAVDTLQVLWTNGILDNQVDVAAAGAPLTLLEKNVAAGSCPFLYAWDGRGFRFVTDVLGNSPLGLSLRRGVVLDADPDELVRLGGAGDLAPRAGAYAVKVTEEMREVLYLDHARLVAVDHPAGTEVHATDKLMPAPFPPSEIVALSALRPAREVVSDDGADRTAALRAIDGEFAPPGPVLPPPWRGMTRALALELDFGPLDASRPLVLALTGWLQYGDASTNIALAQSSAAVVVPPRLEAQTAAGPWQPIDVVVGMPAGKTKTVLVDLAGKLPPGARRLRLTTSFEIRWDRIALGERLPATAFAQHSTLPAQADLAWRGFSEIRSRAPGHPTTPDFDAVSQRPPWRTALQGWATRYGDVAELVRRRDGRLVIVNAGDALELTFDAADLPPVAAGRERTFFFYSVGWDKDGDPNVVDGETIEPLPVASEEDDWRVRYNTRWVPRDRFAEPPAIEITGDPAPSRARR